MIKFTQEQETILKANFEKHGEAFMRDKLVEELSELLCELCKHKTKGNRITQISEEYADVLCVLKQFNQDVDVDFVEDTEHCIKEIVETLANRFLDYMKDEDYFLLGYLEIHSDVNITIVLDKIRRNCAKMERKQNQSLPYEVNH